MLRLTGNDDFGSVATSWRIARHPAQNVKIFAGKPLFEWALRAACECDKIDQVIVSTDADYIADAVRSLSTRAEVDMRSPELATSTASTESVMLDIASKYDFSRLVTLQATSPLTEAKHLHDAFADFEAHEYDSMLSAVRSQRFFWYDDAQPINYDPTNRPRRQDFHWHVDEWRLLHNLSANLTVAKMLSWWQYRYL